MTIDEVKRTAQKQVNKALKEQSRFVIFITVPASLHVKHHMVILLVHLGLAIGRKFLCMIVSF